MIVFVNFGTANKESWKIVEHHQRLCQLVRSYSEKIQNKSPSICWCQSEGSAKHLITHVHNSVRKNNDGSSVMCFFFRSARSDLPVQLNAGTVGVERCQGGAPVTHQTSELTPSQLHSYLNWPLPHRKGSKDVLFCRLFLHLPTPWLYHPLRQINTAILPFTTAAVFTTAILKSFTVIKKKSFCNSLLNDLSLATYYGISLVIKSQGVQNVPNRQLHATTKASKSFPDCCAVDQGEGEAQGKETKAK